MSMAASGEVRRRFTIIVNAEDASHLNVPVRVHHVIVKGVNMTSEPLIKEEIEALQDARCSVQELLQAVAAANTRLRQLEVFDSVNITLDFGPAEFQGTANLIVEVVETRSPFSDFMAIFSKPVARYWSLLSSLKLKNLFGYIDLRDCSLVYGWERMSELSPSRLLPRLKGLNTPITALVPRLSQCWLYLSFYRDQSLGVSLGLLSSKNHDVTYNLSWHALRSSWGRQFCLDSVLKYTYRIDTRNSLLRPTQGYAIVSSSQVGGLVPYSRRSHFFLQEVDLRYAFPFGFYNAALNFGIAASGVLIPCGALGGYPCPILPDRFFVGGNSSPVWTLGGLKSLLGLHSRAPGPTEPRRLVRANDGSSASDTSSARDCIVRGDLAVAAFADLSFDLPLRVLREAGIRGHTFACAGSLTKLTNNAFRNLSFRYSFRSSVGFGIVVPTRLFRMEVNYCYMLKQQEHYGGNSGVQFRFSWR